MAYKANFHPLEGLIDGRWKTLDPERIDLPHVDAALARAQLPGGHSGSG